MRWPSCSRSAASTRHTCSDAPICRISALNAAAMRAPARFSRYGRYCSSGPIPGGARPQAARAAVAGMTGPASAKAFVPAGLRPRELPSAEPPGLPPSPG